jgi:RNA polymerase sigma-70 factor (ECF subfamily)
MLATREHQFTAMHSEYFGRVYRYIAYRVNDSARAEELTADVFRIAWEKDFLDVPGLGWLLATARNLVGNEYRGRQRSQQLAERLQAEVRVSAQPGDDAERAAVAQVLLQLSDKDREVLMLSYWDGLTTAELAATLNCSVSAAGVRLHRARKAFARIVPAHLMMDRKG